MVWMITVDGNINQTDSGNIMFERERRNYNKIIHQVTPSVACALIYDVFFVYDIVKKQIIDQQPDPSHFSSFYAISPDGRFRLVYNRRTRLICIIPLEMTKEAIRLTEKAVYDENADKVWSEVFGEPDDDEGEEEEGLSLQVASYPMKNGDTVDALMMIDSETTQRIDGIESMVGNRLYIKMWSNIENNYDIIFHNALRPISTVKSPTGRWARIMSDLTLETHLTWPANGIKLSRIGSIKNIADAFEGDPELLTAIAWFSCNRFIESEKEAVPAGDAIGIYLQRVAHSIAVAVGLF